MNKRRLVFNIAYSPAKLRSLGGDWDGEEELGMIRYLGPQERIRFEMEIGVLVGKEEIDEFVEKVSSITGGS